MKWIKKVGAKIGAIIAIVLVVYDVFIKDLIPEVKSAFTRCKKIWGSA